MYNVPTFLHIYHYIYRGYIFSDRYDENIYSLYNYHVSCRNVGTRHKKTPGHVENKQFRAFLQVFLLNYYSRNTMRLKRHIRVGDGCKPIRYGSGILGLALWHRLIIWRVLHQFGKIEINTMGGCVYKSYFFPSVSYFFSIFYITVVYNISFRYTPMPHRNLRHVAILVD